MTTATTVLGLLPLSVSEGEGASTLWRALTLTTIGGLIASTVLVLTTIPALYLIVMTRTAEREAARRIAHV
jgi:multidrug efflux pump subunit AcrB